MADESSKGLAEYAAIRYLDPKTSVFSRTPGGFVSLRVPPDEDYPRVNLHRAFPFSAPDRYISVRDPEGKEIGVIESISDLPEQAKKVFSEELDRRYFTPVIKNVNSVKEEFGYTYWDVETDSGPRRFTVRGGHNDIITISDCRVLVVDVDGNRFEIPDYTRLDSRSFKIVETLL